MNPICLLLGSIFNLPNCQPPQQSGPIIVTTLGPVEGTTFPGIDGSTVRAFRGIPYGHLEARGQPSVPLAPWQAVRSGARVAAPCPAGSNTAKRENCLLLNVYVPAGRKNNNALLPTVVVLLSEELVPPSPGSPSPSSLLASGLIPQGVALITVQYRSGVFGFLHSESPNTGLFDVVTAFRFLLDNAEAFSLDQTKITLAGFGEGAQVASVLSLSPAFKGLLHGLALFSGSSFTIGGTPDPTEKFLSRLDCGNQTESVCFRHLTLEQVEEAADGLQFHPTVGEMLVPSEPSVLLDSRHKFPTMMTISDYPDQGVTNEEFAEYIKNVARRFETGVWQRIHAETKIKNYYYPLEGELIEEQFADLKSDVSYRIGAVREAKARSVYAPVYVSRMDDNYNELMLLLEAGMNDHKRFLVDSIVAFVKTGNPSTTRLAWPKYGDEEQYLFVGNTTFVAKGFLDEELVFWSDLCKEMRKDIFTGERLPDPDSGSQLTLLVTFIILVLLQ